LAITDKVENTSEEVEEEIDENILSGEEKAVSLEANEENANSVIVVDKLDDDLENLSFDEEDFNEDEEIAPKGKPKIKKGPKKCN